MTVRVSGESAWQQIQRLVPVVMFANRCLDCLSAGHRCSLPHQRRPCPECEAGRLPYRVQQCWPHAMLSDELIEHCDVLLLSVPHVLPESISSALAPPSPITKDAPVRDRQRACLSPC